MIIYHLILWLFLVAATVDAEATTESAKTMIDEKSEKTKEDLEKVKETLTQLNTLHAQSMKEGGDNGTESYLKEVMALDLGPKTNETIDESAINAGIGQYVMGGDIAVNPQQAAALIPGAAPADEGVAPPEKKERRKRASLFNIPTYVDTLSKIFFRDEPAKDAPATRTLQEPSSDEPSASTVRSEVLRDEVATPLRAKRGFQTDPKYMWDITKPIPYFFDPAFPPSRIPVMRQAIAFWQNNSCLNFVEDQNGDSALRIFSGGGCYASQGRQGTKTQDVSIGSGCDNFGTATHELNHAIGFYHTMSRPDRDESVVVNKANIQDNQMYNFVLNSPSADNSFNVPFDYGSVMLYNQYAFANDANIPTTVAKNKWMQNTMGQRAGPAFSDVKQVNLAFKCDAKCPGKTCSNGGFANSRDCTKRVFFLCVCPRGFGGDSCDTLAKSDAPVCTGGTLTADLQPQTVVASVGTADYTAYPVASNCWWMINAPAGKKIVFNLTAAPSSCVQNCAWQGVEIIMGSFDTFGVTMCCPSMIGQEFTSTGNMAIVRGFARSNLANFSFTYRYF